MGLRTTTSKTDYGTAVQFAGHALPDGWYVVVAGRRGHRINSNETLEALTTDSTAIVCSIEEHVMFSSAEGWDAGRRIWRVIHDSEKGKRHIESGGDLPAIYGAAIEDAKRQQDEEDAGPREVDFFFEAPLQIAKSLCGFKHDEECPGVDPGQFTRLESLESPARRKRWQFWMARRPAQPSAMEHQTGDDSDTDSESVPHQDPDSETRSPAKKYLSQYQNWISIGLISFLLLVRWVVLELERRHIEGYLVNGVLIAAACGIIGAGIWFTRRSQKNAISKFNLTCGSCGYVPKHGEIALSQATRRCRRCRKPLQA